MLHTEVVKFLLTLSVSLAGGLLLRKLKFPAGTILGSMIAALVFNLLTPYGYMPKFFKNLAQVLCGVYIATTIKRSDIVALKRDILPILFLIFCHVFLNLTIGTLIYALSSFDSITCYTGLIPGGMSEIPIVAEELGGESAIVLTMQFLRILFSILIFPLVANAMPHENIDEDGLDSQKTKNKTSYLQMLLILAFGTLGGIILKSVNFPAGCLVGAIVFGIFYQLKIHEVKMPKVIRIISQILAGAYLGCVVHQDSVVVLMNNFFLIAGGSFLYVIGCLLCSLLMFKIFKIGHRSSCMALMPASASEVAMIAAELKINAGRVVFMQTTRVIFSLLCFPILIKGLTGIGFPFF